MNYGDRSVDVDVIFSYIDAVSLVKFFLFDIVIVGRVVEWLRAP